MSRSAGPGGDERQILSHERLFGALDCRVKRHHRQLEALRWTRVSADVTPARRSTLTVYVKTVMRASIKTRLLTQASANIALSTATTNFTCTRARHFHQTELACSPIHKQGLARAVIVLPMPSRVLAHASARLDITVCTLFKIGLEITVTYKRMD